MSCDGLAKFTNEAWLAVEDELWEECFEKKVAGPEVRVRFATAA